MVEFKVYRLNEFDTVAARSLEEAIEWYKKDYVGSDDVDIDDPYEVEPNARMWDVPDVLGKEANDLYRRVSTQMDENSDDGVWIDGKFYTIIGSDVFYETTYGERLKRLNLTEPTLFSSSEM